MYLVEQYTAELMPMYVIADWVRPFWPVILRMLLAEDHYLALAPQLADIRRRDLFTVSSRFSPRPPREGCYSYIWPAKLRV